MKMFFLIMCTSILSGCMAAPDRFDERSLVQTAAADGNAGASSQPAFEDINLSGKKRLQVLTNRMQIEQQTDNYLKGGQADIMTLADGTVLYPYGLSPAALTAKRMMYSKIVLQEGEKIVSAAAGDTIRWNIMPSYIGDASRYTPVVLIKPLAGGLQTSLSIITDRRDYDIAIQSVDSGDYIQRIGFYYPQDRADAIRVGLPPDRTGEDNRKPKINVEHIKYDYRITGDTNLSWYPLSVFEDGNKVFIRMPDKAQQSQLPVLMTFDHHGETEMVNYRYYKPYYVVDTIFDRGVLILGTDKYRQAVRLTRI